MTGVRDLRFTPASASLARGGMLGWVSFRLGDGWLVDGVAVRRTLGGELRLSFPARVDGAGREHPYLLPACNRAWGEVLALVEEALKVLRPAPRGAHVEAAGADEDVEELGSHRGQRTARGQER